MAVGGGCGCAPLAVEPYNGAQVQDHAGAIRLPTTIIDMVGALALRAARLQAPELQGIPRGVRAGHIFVWVHGIALVHRRIVHRYQPPLPNFPHAREQTRTREWLMAVDLIPESPDPRLDELAWRGQREEYGRVSVCERSAGATGPGRAIRRAKHAHVPQGQPLRVGERDVRVRLFGRLSVSAVLVAAAVVTTAVSASSARSSASTAAASSITFSASSPAKMAWSAAGCPSPARCVGRIGVVSLHSSLSSGVSSPGCESAGRGPHSTAKSTAQNRTVRIAMACVWGQGRGKRGVCTVRREWSPGRYCSLALLYEGVRGPIVSSRISLGRRTEVSNSDPGFGCYMMGHRNGAGLYIRPIEQIPLF